MALVSPTEELISDEWFAEVEKIVGARDGDGDGDGNGNGGDKKWVRREIGRVPGFIAEEKPEAYYPQIVSLGPYYHRSLAGAPLASPHPLSRLSHMEMDKLFSLKSAAHPTDIRSFHENTVLHSKSELEEFYNCKIMDSEKGFLKFAWMMTVDSFYLHHFLKDKKSRPSPHHPATGSIKCDIVKLENQIPLFLLKEVHSTLLRDDDFEKFLKDLMPSLCSFREIGSQDPNVAGEQHLLGCMHRSVSSFLRMELEKPLSRFKQSQIAVGDSVSNACRLCCFPEAMRSGPKVFKMNAAKLVKHGIKLRPFTEGTINQKIRFDRYSATLYLPRLTVSDMFTEVVLRNMLALEFVETGVEAVVTQYVELMKSLIHTRKDVKVLRKRGVIVPASGIITDEYIAAMWKGINKFFFAGSLQPSDHSEEIKEALYRNYYMGKGKAVCLGKLGGLLETPLRLCKLCLLS